MTFKIYLCLLWLTSLALALIAILVEAAPLNIPDSDKITLPKDIHRIFQEKCSACHSGDEAEAQFNVDTLSQLMAGSEKGASIVPGKPQESLLWNKIKSNEMPPEDEEKLTEAEKKKIQQWIQTGKFPSDKEIQQIKLDHLVAEANKHWSFRPVKKQKAPVVKNKKWVRSEIDRFVLARLEVVNIEPSKDANPYTLLRRIHFDLTGLPPDEKEIQQFLYDVKQSNMQTAFEKVVDQLLSSTEFGERWGRHWLDVARYSDTLGGGANFTLIDAWRYRDYVIHSFNKDKPYNQFVTEQIAGDLMTYDSAKQQEEQIIATGFLALGPKDFTDQDKVKLMADAIDEQLDTLGKAFMGLAIGCARCHGHKFDPIPLEDYYALAGVMRSTQTLGELDDAKAFANMPSWNRIPLPTMSEQKRKELINKSKSTRESLSQKANLLKLEIKKIKKLIALNKNNKSLKEQLNKLEQQKKDVDSEVKKKGSLKNYFGESYPSILGVLESKKQVDARINLGGNPRQLGSKVQRGVIRAIGGQSDKIPNHQSGRLQLAKWLTSSRHPLTSRVMVNRIWGHLLGRGIVESVDNFGTTGSKPSHPQLLDHLAYQFVEDGWSVKKMIRRIVLSRTYQLASERNSAATKIDPDNKLLWKRTTRRLDVEALRDSLLELSGQLSNERGGPTLVHAGILSLGFRIKVERAGLWKRRSVYLPVYRSMVINNKAMMPTFDFADPNFVVGHRTSSIVPTQALFMMNNDLTLNSAETVASRLLKEEMNDSDRIRSLYLSVFGRPVKAHELKRALKFLKLSTERLNKQKPEQARLTAWTSFTQVMFSSSQFLLVN